MDIAAVLSFQYESQHFGFHPRTLLDLVYNVFFENIYTCLNHLEQFMMQEFNEILPPNVIQSQTASVMQTLIKKCDKSIDKLEVYLNSNVFLIPSYVVLPEDQIHIKSPCTAEDCDALDKEIEELKKSILEEKAKKYALKKKISEQKQIKEHLDILQNELSTLLVLASEDDVNIKNIESFFKDLIKLLENCTSSFKTERC